MTMQIQHNRGGSRKSGGRSYRSTLDGKESNQMILIDIASEMNKENIPEIFIINTFKAALDFEGIADLMILWKNENDPAERNEIIADIQDMLDACLQKEVSEEFYVKFNDLDTISNNIRRFKDSLLYVVEQNGGVKNLSDLTKIPQPSLSRFFNSNSMPQRSTLIKIAKALNIDELKMDSFWNEKNKSQSK
jgi:DNA-binding phage protein